MENRKRLKKQRNPQSTGNGGAKVSLADRIAQKREEIQEVVFCQNMFSYFIGNTALFCTYFSYVEPS